MNRTPLLGFVRGVCQGFFRSDVAATTTLHMLQRQIAAARQLPPQCVTLSVRGTPISQDARDGALSGVALFAARNDVTARVERRCVPDECS